MSSFTRFILIQTIFSGRFNKDAVLFQTQKCQEEYDFVQWDWIVDKFLGQQISTSIKLYILQPYGTLFYLRPLGTGKYSVWKKRMVYTQRKRLKYSQNLKVSMERTIYFLLCIYCPGSVYEFGDTCISQEAGDISLQNNIFTLKIYKNMNSFVPEALGDCPSPLFLCGGVAREKF